MTHHPALPEWQTLEHQIEVLQIEVLQHFNLQHLYQSQVYQSQTAATASPPQYLSSLENLRQQVQGQMTPSAEQVTLPVSTQRHITELHRLMRLALTDAALWQNSRSGELRQKRFGQLGDRLTLLHQHAHAIVEILRA